MRTDPLKEWNSVSYGHGTVPDAGALRDGRRVPGCREKMTKGRRRKRRERGCILEVHLNSDYWDSAKPFLKNTFSQNPQ